MNKNSNEIRKVPTKGNIPKLRFPEFVSSNESLYKSRKFSDVFTFSTGKNIKQSEASSEFRTPCVRYGELYHMYNEVIDEIKNRTNLNESELLFSKGDEILLPSAGEDPLDIGSASALTLRNVAIGRTINILRPEEKNVYSQTYASYYINQILKRKISKLAKGSSISNVYNSDLKKLTIILPSLSEQEKVASFLILIDSRISTQNKIVEDLKSLSKGLQQKIFSQQLRFKDDNGNDFPEWETKKVSSVLNERNNKAPKSKTHPLMAFVANIGVTHKGERYNREFLVNKGNDKKYKQTEYGDFIYSSNNLETGSIGLNRFGSASISPVYSIFKIKESFNIDFISRYFVRIKFIGKMIKFRQGVVYGQWRIHESDFLKIEDNFPSLEEQTKIANFLSSLDAKLEKEKQLLEQYQQQKKYLLQNLFV